jgi:hypothetical protein
MLGILKEVDGKSRQVMNGPVAGIFRHCFWLLTVVVSVLSIRVLIVMELTLILLDDGGGDEASASEGGKGGVWEGKEVAAVIFPLI